jgi:phosphohistidine phosphatase SixA
MQQLMILRHAKAVPWSPVAEDFPRVLRPAGRKHARKVAAWISDNLQAPQSILCSPSQRTRETLAPLLSLNPQLESVTHFIPQLYHAVSSTLQTLLDAAFAEADRVLVIGHNPAFENLVGEVIHVRHRPEFRRLPTGTLAVVDFDPDWLSGQGGGTLSHFVRGKHL